jgi:hypothetical protein
VRLKLGLDERERCLARLEWHPWFAWHPVRITGTNDGVWLEWIERVFDGYGLCEYRLIPKDEI